MGGVKKEKEESVSEEPVCWGCQQSGHKRFACPLKKKSPKTKVGVCWSCFRPRHLREDRLDMQAKFGLSGYADTERVAKEEALPLAEPQA